MYSITIFRLIFFLLFFNTQITFANEIVYIDVDLLFSESKKGKTIILNLKEINKKNQNELKKKEEQLITLKSQIESQKNILKKDEFDKKVKEFNISLKDFDDLRLNLEKNYEEVKNNEIAEFFKNITPILEKFMVDKSIKLIIDKKNIFLANNQLDVTTEILNMINKNFN